MKGCLRCVQSVGISHYGSRCTGQVHILLYCCYTVITLMLLNHGHCVLAQLSSKYQEALFNTLLTHVTVVMCPELTLLKHNSDLWYNCIKTYWVKLRVKLFMHVCIASMLHEITLQSAKSIPHHSPTHKELGNLCFGPVQCITGAHLQCGKNLACLHDYFVETVFVSANTDQYQKTYLPW